MLEADLYAPVKAHLEACGYTVRGEVGHCDIVGWNETHALLVAVELKRSFGLPVLHQAVRRLAMVDHVYVGVAIPEGKRARATWDAQLRDTIRICRMLGIGLLSIRHGDVIVHVDPAPYAPRKFPARRGRLLGEFQRRSGDHNVGGSSSRPRMTAYREDALRCAHQMRAADAGLRVALVRDSSGVARAATLMHRNVYGWFEKVGRGQYRLTPGGQTALERYSDVVAAQVALNAAGSTPSLSESPRRKARVRSAQPPAPANQRDSRPEGPAS